MNSNDSFLGKLRSVAVNAARKLRDGMTRLGAATQTLNADVQAFNPNSADPFMVKSQIPRSHFTKKGPGVDEAARQAFASMTPDQRETARRMGYLR